MGLDNIFDGLDIAAHIFGLTLFVSVFVYAVFYIFQSYIERKVHQNRRNIFISNFHCLLELAHHKTVYMSCIGLKVLIIQYPECFTEIIQQSGTKVSCYKRYSYWSKNRRREESVTIILDPKMEGMIYDVQTIEYTIENVNDLYLLNSKEG